MTIPVFNVDANGIPTQVGTITPPVASVNLAALQSLAQQALATNAAALALADPTAANNTYLAIASPTNAQVVAQVRALTQQMNAVVAQLRAVTQQNNYLIRLAIGQLDATN